MTYGGWMTSVLERWVEGNQLDEKERNNIVTQLYAQRVLTYAEMEHPQELDIHSLG